MWTLRLPRAAFVFLATLVVGLWVLGPGLATAAEPRVILVSIDGMAAYHVADETLVLPNLRALIGAGVVADSSETVFPSVTHPSHTTMVTGVRPLKHGVIGNRLRNRLTGERFHVTNLPHTVSVKVPTLFDAARAAGMRTASYFWPESREDPALDRSIPEVFTEGGVADREAADPVYLQELREARVPIDLFYDAYGRDALVGAGDVALAVAAAHEIRTRRPHLLAIHFVSTDATQHRYGPRHELSRASLTVADGCLGVLRDAVADAGLEEDTTFVVAADHGFHTVTHEVNVAPVFRAAGLSDRLAFHPMEWTLFVETTAGFDPDRDGPALESALGKTLALEGIGRIVRPEAFHDLGYPRYEEDLHVPGQYMIIGDIDTFVVADPDSSSTERRPLAEPHHTHGYPPDHPRMYPGLVLSGRGIRRDERIGHVHNLDIAPTIARLLGLEMEGLEGRVLEEALVTPSGTSRRTE
jgi:arylsulfatase A-like enzyme